MWFIRCSFSGAQPEDRNEVITVSFADVHGKEWLFKAPCALFTKSLADIGIRCELAGMRPCADGHDIFIVRTDKPDAIHATVFGHVFEVAREQLLWVDDPTGVPLPFFKTLKEQLREWTDIDVAQHALAQCVGLMPLHVSWSNAKGLYWTINPLGDALYASLRALQAAQVIEQAPEDDTLLRWNASFKSRWEP